MTAPDPADRPPDPAGARPAAASAADPATTAGPDEAGLPFGRSVAVSSQLAGVRVAHLPFETVGQARPSLAGPVRGLAEVWGYRELLGNLVRKELKVKYKDSLLGYLWTLLRPLTQLLVYGLAIGVFLGANRSIPQFGLYLFTGLLTWTLLSDILVSCTGAVVNNAGLVKKVYFPRELFPLSVVGASLVNFLLQSLVLLLAYLALQSWPSAGDLALVPLAVLTVLVWGTALGLALSAANVYLRDMTYLVELGLMVWFWMTPVVYSWRQVRDVVVGDHGLGWLWQLYLLNPMANVVMAMQKALWPAGSTPKGSPFVYEGNLYGRLGVMILAGLVLLWLCQLYFQRAQGNFAQEL